MSPLGTATVIRGDARQLPIPDNTVDLVVTSPPYFGLRSYQDGGTHYDGQVGAEPTPAEFVAALLDCTREMVRVLKPSGSLWVNLGDKYAQSASQWQGSRRGHQGILAGTSADEATRFGQSTWNDAPSTGTARTKSLIGIPWRYALACIDQLGLILRAEIIWSKPNGLPESVTDRVRRSHEQWFHFTVEPRYYSAVDEIREAHADVSMRRMAAGFAGNTGHTSRSGHTDGTGANGSGSGGAVDPNPLGKLPGSVWTIPTEPLTVPDRLGVDHFAAFPTEWPRRIITGWSPAGVCTGCGEGRRPVADRTPMQWRPGPSAEGYSAPGASRVVTSGTMLAAATTTITGYACACSDTTAPTTPGVVLDPFGGTGTTAMVAKALGRHGITVDLSADYCRLAEWRTNNPDQIAKVCGIKRSDHARAADQLDMDPLFDLDAS